jgi:hypothetical protein
MKRVKIIQQYVREGVRYTFLSPQPAPSGVNYTSKHLGKSDSAQARATGRHNHG